MDCFTDSSTISNISGSETLYTLTGLEEGAEYSLTVPATLTGGGDTEQDTITATTMAAGESTSRSSLSQPQPLSHTHSSIHALIRHLSVTSETRAVSVVMAVPLMRKR